MMGVYHNDHSSNVCVHRKKSGMLEEYFILYLNIPKMFVCRCIFTFCEYMKICTYQVIHKFVHKPVRKQHRKHNVLCRTRGRTTYFDIHLWGTESHENSWSWGIDFREMTNVVHRPGLHQKNTFWQFNQHWYQLTKKKKKKWTHDVKQSWF